MSDLIAVTGNLTSPPERHDLSGGVTLVTFGLASTERRWENGAWVDAHTNFYSVSVFRRLAEHAYSSLEKGQRVIVAGKLKVRRWESNGRSGTSVDLEATSLGPDLMFGSATFSKDGASGSAAPAVQSPADEWAVGDVGGAAGSAAEVSSSAVAPTTASPDSAAAAADAGNDTARLVAAGGWGAPLQDSTPF